MATFPFWHGVGNVGYQANSDIKNCDKPCEQSMIKIMYKTNRNHNDRS